MPSPFEDIQISSKVSKASKTCMMTGCLARSIDIFLVKDQAFNIQALTAHCGNCSRHPLRTRRIVRKKYLSNSFSRLCPTDSLFVGRSVINSPLSSKFLKREPSTEVLKLKPSFESTTDHIDILKTQKRQKIPDPRILTGSPHDLNVHFKD